jgi:5-phospho-D-xylono-1,4-lactonase
MSIIRTVLGDLEPAQAGLVYAHEHIVIEEGFATLSNPDFVLSDTDKICAELAHFYQLGGRTMVDTMPANAGRNVLKLAEVARRTQVNIVVPTGLHLEIYYPPNHWRYHYSEDQLTDLFVADVQQGIDRHDYGGPLVERTAHRAGMIKLATGDDPISPHQEKIFRAVVNTHRLTGVPILTHTNFGRHALAQAELLAHLGADLRHVVLSHVDRNPDVGYHHALMQTGVRVEYDSAFRWKPGEPNLTYQLLQQLLPRYPAQLTMGMDLARRTYWQSFGGKPGLGFLLTTFKTDLEQMGLGQYYPQLFFGNPQQLYTFARPVPLK